MGFSLHDIKIGLDQDEFCFFFQPKISFMTGKTIGAEALVRWRRDGQWVSPNDFIPISEGTGFITLITEKLFGVLISDLDKISREYGKNVPLAFNISAHDLKSRRFYQQVQESLDRGEFDPRNIQFEMTESTVADMSVDSIQIMHDFKNMGITLALDDFGTGYSSLEVLSTFPFSLIKLDKSIVGKIFSSDKAANIIGSNIRMAQRIGMRIVAEGIETCEVYKKLLYGGCHQGQGFFMAKPMETDDFIGFLRKDKQFKGKPIGLVYQSQLDHIQWRKDLMEMFYQIRNSHYENIDYKKDFLFNSLMRDHTRCNLGQWYYGDGKIYQNHIQYKELEKPHENLHREGRLLLEGVLNNRNDDSLVMKISKINKISGEIIRILQDLENRVHHDDQED
ncbi:MAG: EAL domain-containing protein [Magnetococcales bacterium]|nr:EAL domain-containing protein [Magnetococcales bacterium]MBF0323180.1 EAL domain-containing protein [Magnetococcales bacterium]